MSNLLLLQEIEYQGRLLEATVRNINNSKSENLVQLFTTQANKIQARITKMLNSLPKKPKKGKKNGKLKKSSKRTK